jgi:hypothetical protein
MQDVCVGEDIVAQDKFILMAANLRGANRN